MLRNGDAWIAYLKANGAEVVEYTRSSAVEVTPAELYKAICDTLEKVWLALVGKCRDLGADQMAEWVDTLQCAVEVMPSGHESALMVVQAELELWK